MSDIEPKIAPHEDIPGWGADADTADRPGVPQEQMSPRGLQEGALVRQQSNGPAPFVGPNRSLTPVYSTNSPPRGVSGLMRRAAYKIPEYRASRWMLLLAADRVDVIEHMKLGRAVVGASAVVIAFSVVKMLRA